MSVSAPACVYTYTSAYSLQSLHNATVVATLDILTGVAAFTMDPMDTDSGVDTENDDGDDVPVASIVANGSNDEEDALRTDDDEPMSNKREEDGGGDTDTVNTVEEADDASVSTKGTDVTPPPEPEPTTNKKRSNSDVEPSEAADNDKAQAEPPKKKARRRTSTGPARKACKGLTIPFRTIKRIMKIDPEIGIVQNDAAIVVTAALEHFVKEMAVKSLEIAKSKGRKNIIKYDDVAEVRANDRALSFLDLLMP